MSFCKRVLKLQMSEGWFYQREYCNSKYPGSLLKFYCKGIINLMTVLIHFSCWRFAVCASDESQDGDGVRTRLAMLGTLAQTRRECCQETATRYLLCKTQLTRVTRKQTLKSLSLSFQKKDGRTWLRASFFWYDTDFLEFESLDFIYRSYSLKVGVIPKEESTPLLV